MYHLYRDREILKIILTHMEYTYTMSSSISSFETFPLTQQLAIKNRIVPSSLTCPLMALLPRKPFTMEVPQPNNSMATFSRHHPFGVEATKAKNNVKTYHKKRVC